MSLAQVIFIDSLVITGYIGVLLDPIMEPVGQTKHAPYTAMKPSSKHVAYKSYLK